MMEEGSWLIGHSEETAPREKMVRYPFMEVVQ
jgi:hypothetical protein